VSLRLLVDRVRARLCAVTLDNDAISRALTEIADLLEIDGQNPFRIRAYRNAAKTIFELQEPALGVKLTSLGGIGADLAGKITDIAKTGTTEVLDDIRKKWPASVRDLLKVDGLGPKRTKLLHDTLGINTVDDLRAAVASGALAKVPGLGASLEKKLAASLKHHVVQPGDGRFPLEVALPIAEELVALTKKLPGVVYAEAAGSLRRRKATVGDLDIVVCGAPGASGAAIIDAFTKFPNVRDILASGDTRGSVKLTNNLQVDMRVVEAESYGAALLYFTGSKKHSIKLRAAAIKLGYKLNEYGIYDQSNNDKKIAGETEHGMYAALGMAYLTPEQRER
jgi:DNA polymerase (family 10)